MILYPLIGQYEYEQDRSKRIYFRRRNKKGLSREFRELLDTLKARFEKNMDHHMGIEWPKVQAKLEGTNE